MPAITVRNIGPLVDTGRVEIAPATLIIGPQSSGKSTLMKLLCFCNWVEKHTMLDGDTFLYDYTHYDRFRRTLKKFHRLADVFFSQNSYLHYEGTAVTIELTGVRGNARITRRPDFEERRHNEKLCFLPAERSLLSALQNTERMYRSADVDLLFNYILEWSEARTLFTLDAPLRFVFDDNLRYYYDRQRDRDMLLLARQSKPLPTFYASSGVQSALPVSGMADYVAQAVGKVGSYTPRDLQIYASNSRNRRGRRTNNVFGSAPDTEALKSAVEELFRYQAFRLYVEEPELNLFPLSQYKLLLQLIRLLKRTNTADAQMTSTLVMTTHSPYMLTAFNVLILAAQAAQRNRAATERIIPADCLLSPADFMAYGITDAGNLESLIDKETNLVQGEKLDSISDYVDELTYELNGLLYGSDTNEADCGGL